MRNLVAHKGGAGAPRTTWQWEDPEGFTRKKPTREDIERVARAVAAEEGGDYSSTAGMFIPFDRETWEAGSQYVKQWESLNPYTTVGIKVNPELQPQDDSDEEWAWFVDEIKQRVREAIKRADWPDDDDVDYYWE